MLFSPLCFTECSKFYTMKNKSFLFCREIQPKEVVKSWLENWAQKKEGKQNSPSHSRPEIQKLDRKAEVSCIKT